MDSHDILKRLEAEGVPLHMDLSARDTILKKVASVVGPRPFYEWNGHIDGFVNMLRDHVKEHLQDPDDDTCDEIVQYWFVAYWPRILLKSIMEK